MERKVRFGDLVREVGVSQRVVSYNDLTPRQTYSVDGSPLPYRPEKVTLRPLDVYRLLTPYFGGRIKAQLQAVVPLAVYLWLFQLLVLRQGVEGQVVIAAGLAAVVLGLMLFMEGLKLGLMPFAEVIGDHLPRKSHLNTVLLIAFLLGIGVTFAEPAIGALKAAGQGVDPQRAPYLWEMLNNRAGMLVLVVGGGVGLAAVLGTLRFLNGWSLKPMIYLSLLPTLALTAYCMSNSDLSTVLGLAWDCGAVTTGPVTVPLVLSLGIGIAAAAGKGNSSLSGFGIVTLASIFPIIGVMSLAVYVFHTTPVEAVLAASAAAGAEKPLWHQATPWVEIIGGVRAIVPLVLFLMVVLWAVLKERLHQPGIVYYGLSLCVLGMIVFSLGLTYGLAELGGQSGGYIPTAFTEVPGVKGSPLFTFPVGLAVALVFAWLLGFGATLAEPALNALGITVENLTNGAFKKSMLMYAVSIGVGFGIMLGVLKIIFSIPLAWLLMPGYLTAALLTWLSSEEFVNVVWDSAGVTTGPVTVPLVLSMGLGFGGAVDAVEGFGILSMASICPILSVLFTGVMVEWRLKRKMAGEKVQHG